jgi:hypothetical protein
MLGTFRTYVFPLTYNITWGVIDLQQRLRILWLFPVQYFRPDPLQRVHFLFRAPEHLLLEDRLRYRRWHVASFMPQSGARKTPSGDPYSRSSLADNRAATPGVNVSVSQEREASSSMLSKPIDIVTDVLNTTRRKAVSSAERPDYPAQRRS